MSGKPSGAVTAAKWGAMAVIAAALIGLVGVLIQRSRTNDKPDGKKLFISGVVIDEWKNEPLGGVNVQLFTPDNNLFSQSTTDQEGKYKLEAPANSPEVLIVVRKEGYFHYDKKAPVSSSNDIPLKRLPQRFGIPDNVTLESALRVIEQKLSIVAPFSANCKGSAKKGRVVSVELEAYRDAPEKVIKEIIDRVKENKVRYEVKIIEPGRRYEINCY